MKVDIRHSPASAVARVTLANGETINVQSGAMYAQSSGVEVEAKMEGGLISAAKRAFISGDSFFMTKVTARQEGAWIDLVSTLPGDIVSVGIDSSRGLILTHGAWLASDLNAATAQA
jgi:uncharacterized protein (AIM24 family)